MFKKNDKLKLIECPFNPEDRKNVDFWQNTKEMIHVVTEVDERSRLVKTNLINDWIHEHWFTFVTSNEFEDSQRRMAA